jgi:hypothetical protein
MSLQREKDFTQKEILERFEILFKRPMTAKERECFFLPPAKEKEDEKNSEAGG